MSQDSSISQSSVLTASPAHDEILYFAYGPTMSSAAMLHHCPGAVPVALAYLPGWRWFVNPRSQASIAPLLPSALDTYHATRTAATSSSPYSSSSSRTSGSDSSAAAAAAAAAAQKEILQGEDGVYGVLYLLPERDEAALDIIEGVGEGFDKAVLEVEIATPTPPNSDAGRTGYASGEAGTGRRQRPAAGFVGWMNRGIREAVRDWGMPGWYVDGVLRRYVPEEGDEDEGVGMET
ncbi:unnamed protein product [Parascedosporium putredinis]|uniref:Gamma-glutamylcyclotransferase n=1 Tax=Parascedosporium putredinis TaxID=1442378 RepID=A0A9P1MG66_9PEZI|nr:unnamed protein product [Parascedosporium putredinis]CAI8003875.1 unnamed protein product [Parascedosporium putredinis]